MFRLRSILSIRSLQAGTVLALVALVFIALLSLTQQTRAIDRPAIQPVVQAA